jgi:hypothetical protein
MLPIAAALEDTGSTQWLELEQLLQAMAEGLCSAHQGGMPRVCHDVLHHCNGIVCIHGEGCWPRSGGLQPNDEQRCPACRALQNALDPTGCQPCLLLQALNDGLQPDEKEAFAFDLESIDWHDYINSHITGLRKFPLKENSLK